MYDDASYYTFIPSVQEENSLKTKHKRKQSLLLKQPDVSTAQFLAQMVSDACTRRISQLTSVC